MATPRIGGAGVPLTTNDGLAITSTGQEVGLTNTISLGAGATYLIPAGTYFVRLGAYTFLQYKDPVLGTWVVKHTAATVHQYILSDGGNWRLANLTGCPIGAIITTGGGAGVYTNGIGSTGAGSTNVSITPSAGSSVWTPVVGGVVSTTAVTGAPGSGYLFPPNVIIDAPPLGGIQATAHVSQLSSGTVLATNIIVDNQGAGYTVAPNVTFVNDSRDTVGAGAAVSLTLTGTGILSAMYPTDHGTPQTSAITFTFAPTGTGTAATAIMNFTVTSYASGTGGSGYATGTAIITQNNLAQGTSQFTNPLITTDNVFPRPARLYPVLSGVTIVTGTATFEDHGLGIQRAPDFTIVPGGSTIVLTGASITLAVGGITDTSYIQPI